MIYLIIIFTLAIFAILDFFDFKIKKEARGRIEILNSEEAIPNKLSFFKYTVYIAIIIILSIFAGLRFYVGLDYSSYSNIFYKIMSGQNVHLEPGFVYFNKLIGNHFYYPTLMFLIFAILTVTFKAIIIKLDTKKVFFALFIAFSLYFLVGTMGQIRSTFAQAIDFIALYLYMKNKRIIPFVLILISALFHVSAIVFLLIFILGARKYNTIFIIGLLIACAALGHFLNIKGIGLEFKDSYGFIGSKLYSYTNVETQKIGISFNVVLDIIIVIFALVMRKVYSINNRKFNLLFNVYVGSLISFLIFNNYFIIGVRFSNYFRLPLILLLPYLIEKIENKRIRILVASIFIFIFFMMNIRFLQANYVFYMPYRMKIFSHIISL